MLHRPPPEIPTLYSGCRVPSKIVTSTFSCCSAQAIAPKYPAAPPPMTATRKETCDRLCREFIKTNLIKSGTKRLRVVVEEAPDAVDLTIRRNSEVWAPAGILRLSRKFLSLTHTPLSQWERGRGEGVWCCDAMISRNILDHHDRCSQLYSDLWDNLRILDDA